MLTKSINPRLFKLMPLSIMIILLLSGCSMLKMLKAQFDPQGNQYAITLHQEALELMAEAGQSYDDYGEKVYQLMSSVEAAYEHARRQRKNNVITGLWDVMRNPQGSRLGGFMAQWKIEGRLTAQRIETVTKWVDEDFQTIIKLEKMKSKKLGKIAIKK